MKLRPALLLLLLTSTAVADVSVPGIKRIPIELELKNQRAFRDASFVVMGCNSPTGRHALAFAEPDAPLTCRLKGPAKVYRTSAATARELKELVAKDLGWGSEGVEARGILEKRAQECGEVSDETNVKESSKVEKLFVSYTLLPKAEAGCQLVGADAGVPAPSASATAPEPPSTPPPSPSPSAPSPAPAPPPRSCNGCAMASRTSPRGLLALGALFSFAFARRRRKLSARGSRR